MSKKRIMSGMRPTGKLHLGNYFGALENWVKLQDEYEAFHSIVDWHALTTGYEDNLNLKENIFNMAVDWLTAGLDPNKCKIFVQSEIKEIAELHLLLSMVIPVTWLERCPTYKDQLTNLSNKNIATYGFLGYPCLMASDILLPKAEVIPVGEDQVPHLEMSREIARRFNHIYGETFPEPQALLTKMKVLPGLDGRKMSKSYENTIALSDAPEEVTKKVKSMITDPLKIKKDDPGHPEVCSVYAYHKIFSQGEAENICSMCKAGASGCVSCKSVLAKNLVGFMDPMYTKRMELLKDKDFVWDILRTGTRATKADAKEKMSEIKEKMNLIELV